MSGGPNQVVGAFAVLVVYDAHVWPPLGRAGATGRPADWITKDLITDLVRVRGLNVIARYSTAISLFLILNSGISGRFYRGLALWLEPVPGGLAQSNIAACTIFSAVSGSSLATAAAVGAVAIPEMRSRNYSMHVTTGTLAAGGTLGILIPPSISLIIYGTTVGNSVGQLFAAGLVPGLILSAGFMAFLFLHAKVCTAPGS